MSKHKPGSIHAVQAAKDAKLQRRLDSRTKRQRKAFVGILRMVGAR